MPAAHAGLPDDEKPIPRARPRRQAVLEAPENLHGPQSARRVRGHGGAHSGLRLPVDRGVHPAVLHDRDYPADPRLLGAVPAGDDGLDADGAVYLGVHAVLQLDGAAALFRDAGGGAVLRKLRRLRLQHARPHDYLQLP